MITIGKTEGRKELLSKIVNVMKKDARISSAFLTGSFVKNETTEFSDIDLWLILLEESGINSFRVQVKDIFSRLAPLYGVYECTAHHYFVVYKSGIQIDLNLMTAAQYFSIKDKQVKKILFDKKLFLIKKGELDDRSARKYAEEKLFVGVTTLERGVSKYIKKEYFVAARFLDSVRSGAILSLLPFIDKEEIPDMVTLNIDNLTPRVRKLFISSYSKPTKKDCFKSIKATIGLLKIVSDELDIKDFDENFRRLEKVLSKHNK